MAKVEKRAGSYTTRVSVADPATGARVQRRLTARTKRELDVLVTQIRAKSQRGETITPNQTPLIEWMDDWYAGYKASPATRHQARRAIDRHIAPHAIARRSIGTLQPLHIQGWVNDVSAGSETRAGLMPSTLRRVYAVLRMALGRAHALRVIPLNPTDGVRLPVSRKHQAVILTREQARTLIQDADDPDDLHAAWVLAVTIGVRGGELMGLRWSDLDLDQREITIARTMTLDEDGRRTLGNAPKTAASARVIPLPQAAVDALHAHRVSWDARRAIAGDLWHPDGAVFDQGLGEHWGHAMGVWRAFERTKQRLGLPAALRLHDLRHTAATHMIWSGMPIPSVSRVLGHANSEVTMRVYAGVIDAMMAESVRIIEGMYDTRVDQKLTNPPGSSAVPASA